MSEFIEWLEGLNEKDTRVRAVLRRSLAFNPGEYIPAYPYVEPFVKNEANSWRREMHYLVAGLWATHCREGQAEQRMSVGKASAAYQLARGSTSTERRFIALLDSDHDQLPHRLRQMIALLKEYPIDFDALLNGLLKWIDEQKPTQTGWARAFYWNMNQKSETEPTSQEEKAL